jgi:hypothetical protein
MALEITRREHQKGPRWGLKGLRMEFLRLFSHPAVPLPFGTIDTEFLFVIILAVLVGLGI